jgi:hypothetical protein
MRAAGCQKNLQQPAAKFSRELVSPACLDLVVKTEIPTYLLITRTPRLGRLSAKLHIKSRTFSKNLPSLRLVDRRQAKMKARIPPSVLHIADIA